METVKLVETIAQAVSGWPQISVHPHRFGGTEFRFGSAEVGHVHSNGIVDIPYPRQIRDELLSQSLAKEHHWVPNSGWITFRMRAEQDVNHALWLLRLSYLRYALKHAADSHGLLARESQALGLSPRFQALLEPFMARTAKPPQEPISA